MPFILLYGTHDDVKSGTGRPVVTKTQAAARLGVAERTFDRFIEMANITPCDERFGNRPVFFEEDIETIKANREKNY